MLIRADLVEAQVVVAGVDEPLDRLENGSDVRPARHRLGGVRLGDRLGNLLEVGPRREVFEAGSFVVLVLGSANRDPAHRGPTADDPDLTREGAAHHVAFGGGAHHCLGAALPRLEGQVAIGRLIERFPRLELAGLPPGTAGSTCAVWPRCRRRWAWPERGQQQGGQGEPGGDR